MLALNGPVLPEVSDQSRESLRLLVALLSVGTIIAALVFVVRFRSALRDLRDALTQL